MAVLLSERRFPAARGGEARGGGGGEGKRGEARREEAEAARGGEARGGGRGDWRCLRLGYFDYSAARGGEGRRGARRRARRLEMSSSGVLRLGFIGIFLSSSPRDLLHRVILIGRSYISLCLLYRGKMENWMTTNH